MCMENRAHIKKGDLKIYNFFFMVYSDLALKDLFEITTNLSL